MFDDAVDSIIGILPVIVTGGVVLKFAEKLFPETSQQKSVKPKRDVYSRNYSGGFGDFRNVGW